MRDSDYLRLMSSPVPPGALLIREVDMDRLLARVDECSWLRARAAELERALAAIERADSTACVTDVGGMGRMCKRCGRRTIGYQLGETVYAGGPHGDGCPYRVLDSVRWKMEKDR